MANLDAAYKKADKKLSRESAVAFKDAIVEYKKARKSYVELLQKEMQKENLLDPSDKAGKEYIAWLKVLETDLKAIESSAKAKLKWYKDILSNKNDYSKSGFADIKALIKEAQTYIAKIKATPTAANWNKNTNDFLREFFIYARVENYKSPKGKYDIATLESLSDRLSDFLSKNELKKKYGQIPNTTSAKDIEDRIEILEAVISDYEKWYKDNKDK
ncbi:MAG: hypothetical protein JXQ76_10495 [Campylobacterales bacterium]|nr:hypothetical protein [Campylobacterales bacterium]